MNSTIIFEKDPRACVNRPGAWPNLSERSDGCSVVQNHAGGPVPPFDNVPSVTVSCVGCGASFATKRPEFAKYCSGKCQNRARGPRKVNKTARTAAHRRRMAKPGVRARYNQVANKNARRIKEWLNAYKLEHGCIDCGYRAHPVALDIDHMSGKSANVSSLKSIKAILAEIEQYQCVVRCSNCHRIKTWKSKAWLGRQVAMGGHVDPRPTLF